MVIIIAVIIIVYYCFHINSLLELNFMRYKQEIVSFLNFIAFKTGFPFLVLHDTSGRLCIFLLLQDIKQQSHFQNLKSLV
jgi:hypothetical protein